MYRAAVMGDWDSIYGFGALGFETVAETGEDKENAEKKLESLAKRDIALIFITEALADRIPEVVTKMRENHLPALILIPGISGNTGEGVRAVKRSVEQAVGSDILFGENG